MLPIRSDINVYEDEDILCFFNDSVITDSDWLVYEPKDIVH